jgi:D-alanine-D-alanine ligase
MKIAVLMGGSSEERDISLLSGKAIFEGLKKKGHDVELYDVEWIGKNTLFPTIDEIKKNSVDVVFLALHGGLGENGGIQGILEAAGIAYTGSGIMGSAIAMNKDVSKSLFVKNEIPTAPWLCGNSENLDFKIVENEIKYPCVIKPVDQGSSVGMFVVKNTESLKFALNKAFSLSELVIAEKYLRGKELSVPIIGGRAFPVIEIKPSHGIYDYECKYTAGMTEYIVPAEISEYLEIKIKIHALHVFRILGLRDIARIDFRLNRGGKPMCLEANTLPGMTATSLVPKSAAKAGMDFPELVSEIAEMAFNRKGK